MRVTETIVIDGRNFVAKELTVGEVRAWLATLATGLPPSDTVGMMLFEEFSLPELAPFVDGDLADGMLAPSEIRQVFDAVKRINPDFFAMRDRLAAIGRAASELPQTPSASLSEPLST